MRAVRATLVIPLLLVITYKVLGDAQMTLFAVFGGFATLVVTSFGGTWRDKLIAHAGLALAGTLAVIIGTLASGSAWLAALVTLPVAFAVYYGGSAGPNAASGVTACLFAYVLPIASAGSASELPSRLEGWLLASAAGTVAVLLLSPRSPGDRLRGQAAHLAGLLAARLAEAVGSTADGHQADDGQADDGQADDGGVAADPGTSTDTVRAAKADLYNAFVATPYRPIGLAAADQGLASLIHLLEWCTALICDAVDGHLDLAAATAEDRALMKVSAHTLRQVAAVMSGQAASADLEPVWRARLASARRLHTLADDPAIAVRRADDAFHAQAIGVATSAALGEALIAARLASPAAVATQRRNWIADLPESEQSALVDSPDGSHGPWAAMPSSTLGTVSSDASLRSVWFRNSARGAVALTAAVAIAKLTDVQHAFWIVLGTLSVLRTSAAATGSTALRGLAGTVAGFAVGAALLLGIGTSQTALWIAFPLAVLVAAYAPGTAPFVVGQAAFTVTIVVLFNLLVPAGWRVGLLRVEDVAIGCAVSLVVGFLFWPRGASAVVGDNLADAFRSGSAYLGEAAKWALGDRPSRPERATTAIAAGNRLDDAVRGFLTEQGSKRMSKTDLWALVMASTRLRLTAHSMASLPSQAEPHADDGRLHQALEQQVADLAGFYDRLAVQVARPMHGAAPPAPVALPPGNLSTGALAPCGGSAAYRSDALWVGHHLDQLQSHVRELTGPAERLAEVRRRPWWR
jgi:hypothetical protein